MIESAIYQLLSNDVGLSALVGDQIWPVVNSTGNTDVDYLVFTLMLGNETLTETLDGGLTQGTLQIDSYSKSHAASRAMAEAVKQLLHTWQHSQGSYFFDRFFQSSLRVDYEDDAALHRVSQDFNFYVREL